jgi:hypothetical protein
MELTNIGTATIDKGVVRDGIKLTGWDSVSICTGAECPLEHKCKYLKKGKCGVQLDYMQNFCNVILKTYRYLDEGALFKVGMHLMPLYSYLCKLKIVEASLTNLTNVTAKGIVQIHPIYKEIRETLKCIVTMCRDLEIFVDGGIPNEDIEPVPTAVDMSNGDPTYYKKMSEVVSRKRLIR